MSELFRLIFRCSTETKLFSGYISVDANLCIQERSQQLWLKLHKCLSVPVTTWIESLQQFVDNLDFACLIIKIETVYHF